jgi:hypothetical protein
MKFMDIINIIAIITGPLFAVLITLWWQERKEKRDKKINLFTMLLAYRKTYPVSPEWARGLNLIDVVFQNHPRVLELWHQYYDMLSSAVSSSPLLAFWRRLAAEEIQAAFHS